jgi:hypothetical protein
MKPPAEQNYSDAEAARRRDAITKALIATPPQKHEPIKAKRSKTKRTKRR